MKSNQRYSLVVDVFLHVEGPELLCITVKKIKEGIEKWYEGSGACLEAAYLGLYSNLHSPPRTAIL